MNKFKEIKVLDNFYQTSSFYPMPVVLATTLNEKGKTNIGAYSLCFPFGISEEHYMMLISRSSSNTATNIFRDKKVQLNFVPNNKKYMRNAVTLGYPGDTTEEKMKESIFTLIKSPSGDNLPAIIEESIQVMECTWIDDKELFHYANDSSDGGEAHFLLKIDKIIMEEKYKDSLVNGNYKFPPLPVDYGYRDSKYFCFAKHFSPYKIGIPKNKGVSADTVKRQVERLQNDVKWSEDSYEKLSKVPRIFLKKVVTSIADRAEKEDVELITPEVLDRYNKKRK